MTREEAIECLEIVRIDYDIAYKDSPIREALNMAIEELKKEVKIMTLAEAIKILNSWLGYFKEEYADWEQNDEIVALDKVVKEVKTGTWEPQGFVYRCSCCGNVENVTDLYCRICGAKMGEE